MSPTRRAKRARGRALRPGLGFVAACAAGRALSLAGCGGGSSVPVLPAEETLHPDVDAALVGTLVKPALQVEGLPVDVKTKAFDVESP